MPDSRHTKKKKARVEDGPRLSFEEYQEKYRAREAIREARAQARIKKWGRGIKKTKRLSFVKMQKSK